MSKPPPASLLPLRIANSPSPVSARALAERAQGDEFYGDDDGRASAQHRATSFIMATAMAGPVPSGRAEGDEFYGARGRARKLARQVVGDSYTFTCFGKEQRSARNSSRWDGMVRVIETN